MRFKRKPKSTSKRGQHNSRKSWNMEMKYKGFNYTLDYSVALNVTPAMTILEPVKVALDLSLVTDTIMRQFTPREQNDPALRSAVFAAVYANIPRKVTL